MARELGGEAESVDYLPCWTDERRGCASNPATRRDLEKKRLRDRTEAAWFYYSLLEDGSSPASIRGLIGGYRGNTSTGHNC